MSTPELRFDGRVAVITGGGRGLGRSYALLMAARGCKVVVNDLGGAIRGDGPDTSVAQSVVDEIVAAGGEAIANADSVATPEGGKAIIQAALDKWGRIDGLATMPATSATLPSARSATRISSRSSTST